MRHIVNALRDRIGMSRHAEREIEVHLRAAAEWILRGQAATPDDGVAHSFDVKKGKWLASYPETTGYIIPTLYDFARYYDAPEYATAAERMARWEVAIQLEDGGVRAGTMAAEIVVPTVFNTGQVLFGLARAFQETGDNAIQIALRRAADWLVDAQDTDGAWRKFPSPFTTAKLNSYNTRSAFGLVRAFEVLHERRYLDAADANVTWTLGRAVENDWLPDNCLSSNEGDIALTHTIAYSIRGILEVGVSTANSAYVDHAIRMARRVAQAQRADGALPGYLNPRWEAAARWSCVTGNSQMAINWLRLSKIAGEASFVDCAVRANRFNMRLQDCEAANPGIRGGLKGSHPLDGDYMTWRYPNWAAKFFMDALMLEQFRSRIVNIG